MKKLTLCVVLAIVSVIAFSAKSNNSCVVYYWTHGFIVHKDCKCAKSYYEDSKLFDDGDTSKLMITLSSNPDINTFPYTKCVECNK